MEELGKSLPLSEGMMDAEQASHHKHANEFCLNCGTKLLDSYCYHCGQKDLPKRQTMRELIENFIGSFFSFESKFFKTVKYLLFKPGFLPIEYIQGRRESYYHPARAYVFISFVYFLLLFSLPDGDESTVVSEDENEWPENLRTMNQKLAKSGIDTVIIKDANTARLNSWEESNGKFKTSEKGTGFSLTQSDYKTIEAYDSAQRALPEKDRDGWFIHKLKIREIELNQRYQGADAGTRFKEEFGQAFFDNFPKVLFWLLPVFALLLKLFYIRRDFYYSEHLVFAIYYYNFFYLAGTVYLLVDLVPVVHGILTTIVVLWMIVYLPVAMKRMYIQSWGKTLLKFSMFSLSFGICLLTGIVVSMLLILINL